MGALFAGAVTWQNGSAEVVKAVTENDFLKIAAATRGFDVILGLVATAQGGC